MEKGRKVGRKERMEEESRGRAKKRWREVTAVAVSNCVDENQTSFISPSHSLPPSLPLHSLSLCISPTHSLSLSEAKNNEVTPLSRTVPYKNSLLFLIPSRTHSFSVHIPSSTRQACSSPHPY